MLATLSAAALFGGGRCGDAIASGLLLSAAACVAVECARALEGANSCLCRHACDDVCGPFCMLGCQSGPLCRWGPVT